MTTILRAAALLIFALCLRAQTTGQLCWTPDKTVPAKSVCKDFPPSVKKSVSDWLDTQVDPPVAPAVTPTPKYTGHGDLFLTHIQRLVDTIIDQFPTNAIATDKATAATATASAEAKKAALLDRAKVAEPK